MIRIFAIAGGLLVGLVGLFMSACGGGLLVSMGYNALSNLFGARGDPNAANVLSVLLLPAGSLALGIVVCRFAYQTLRKHLKDR